MLTLSDPGPASKIRSVSHWEGPKSSTIETHGRGDLSLLRERHKQSFHCDPNTRNIDHIHFNLEATTAQTSGFPNGDACTLIRLSMAKSNHYPLARLWSSSSNFEFGAA